MILISKKKPILIKSFYPNQTKLFWIIKKIFTFLPVGEYLKKRVARKNTIKIIW